MCPKKYPGLANINTSKSIQFQSQARNGNQALAQNNRGQQNFVRGKVNHVTAGEDQDAQDIEYGMSLENSRLASV